MIIVRIDPSISESNIYKYERGNIGLVEKSTGDKTWDVSEIHGIGHWEHHKIIEISCSVSCNIVKSSSKP